MIIGILIVLRRMFLSPTHRSVRMKQVGVSSNLLIKTNQPRQVGVPLLFFSLVAVSLIWWPGSISAGTYDLRYLRASTSVGFALSLPTGHLSRPARGAPFKFEFKREWHLVSSSFKPFEAENNYGGQEFRRIYQLLEDKPLPSDAQDLLMFPSSNESQRLAKEFGVEDLGSLLNSLSSNKMGSTCRNQEGFIPETAGLLCFLFRIHEGVDRKLAVLPIALGSKDTEEVALLVFERKDIFEKIKKYKDCKTTEVLGQCVRPLAILLHDTSSIKALLPEPIKITTAPDIYEQTARDLAGLFRVVSFKNPAELLDQMIQEVYNTKLPSDVVIYSSRHLLQGNGRIGAAAPAFANEVLLYYANAVTPTANGKMRRILLRLALPGPSDAGGLIGSGRLGTAFLPSVEENSQRPEFITIPEWLYRRLASVAMSAQYRENTFCKLDTEENTILWKASDFHTRLGSSDSVAVDTQNAHNSARNGLYQDDCKLSDSSRQPDRLVLTNRMASSGYSGELCGQQTTDAKLSGVAGKFRMSPVISPPPQWADQAKFVLVDQTKGVYLQQKPVSLGAFGKYLTSFAGCQRFKSQGGYAKGLMRCDEPGMMRLEHQLSEQGDEATRRDSAFGYFYGATNVVLNEVIGEPVNGLQCHSRPASLARTPRERTDDMLCSLQFFFASRSVDALLEPELPKAISDKKGKKEPKGFREMLGLKGGKVDEKAAIEFMRFSGCRASDGLVHSRRAQALCDSLQHYIRAAFRSTADRGWKSSPVSMITQQDAQNYIEWIAAPHSPEDGEAGLQLACKEQLGLPSEEALKRATVTESMVHESLVPMLRQKVRNPATVQGNFDAAVLASGHLMLRETGGNLEMAGLPVGFRQISKDTMYRAHLPNFQNIPDIAMGYGLPPGDVMTYFDQKKHNAGQCLDCVLNRRAFWWRVWQDDQLDDPTSVKRTDPATGFRLSLTLK